MSLIDSDPARYREGYGGRSREAWQEIYVARRAQLLAGVSAAADGRAAGDKRAVQVMRAAVEDSPPTPETLAPAGRCQDAQQPALPLPALQQALYACFAELANHLQFENTTVPRVAAFELLTRIEEPRGREALFRAFVPLWQALNGDDGPTSPYRRMIRMAAAQAGTGGSPIDAAAHTVGASVAEIEQWLEQILDAWSRVSSGPLEPWDYRFASGSAERALAAAIPRAALLPLNDRYYRDLGFDVTAGHVLYDIEPRAGKAPLAYTDYIRRGRLQRGVWVPTLVRVSATYPEGGLGPLNELVHESGHAAHMMALRTRPAFMDLGEPIFYEAFADVPAWSVYEPDWQQKYLGVSAATAAALRALYSGVMLDVAWALFDLRMLRDPQADPNAVWTDITARFLHVQPHPELAWWAVRVQLVHKPGYMVNYGLGAVITADIRQRIARQLGPFASGDPRWYGWLSRELLGSGEEQETAQLLRRFLGRPVSPQALLEQLHRIGAPETAAGGAPAASGG
ncbi:MAG: hypothetical protein JO184_12965 [Gammaproteobacteria bacterium]|nr:hypothetical protein [Gammaproteobacteria bacterium]